MECLISTWIPRSYLHLREAYKKLSKLKLTIKDIQFEGDTLQFVLPNFFHNKPAIFRMYATGLYTLQVSFDSQDELHDIEQEAVHLLQEVLIKSWHTVAYKQIQEKHLSSGHSVMVFGAEKDHIVQNETRLFISKPFKVTELPLYRSYQLGVLLQKFIDELVEGMEHKYHLVDTKLDSLKGDFELSDLKKLVFEFDYLEREVVETLARLQDSQEALLRQKRLFETSKSSAIGKKLGIQSLLLAVESDLVYTKSLWEQLQQLLENFENAASARLSFQETVESRRMEWFLSVEAASVLATLLISIFIKEVTGVGAVYFALVFLVTWFAIYFVMTRLRAR